MYVFVVATALLVAVHLLLFKLGVRVRVLCSCLRLLLVVGRMLLLLLFARKAVLGDDGTTLGRERIAGGCSRSP